MRIVLAICSLAVAGASAFLMQTAQIDIARAETRVVREDLAALKVDRADTLKAWRQDQIENAKFQSAVLTKLERIEKAVR